LRTKLEKKLEEALYQVELAKKRVQILEEKAELLLKEKNEMKIVFEKKIEENSKTILEKS
jgi:hypothetical protein